MGDPGKAMDDLEGSAGRGGELVVEAYSPTAEESPPRQAALSLDDNHDNCRPSPSLDDGSAPRAFLQLREAWPQSVMSDGRKLVVCTIDVQFLTGGSRCSVFCIIRVHS